MRLGERALKWLQSRPSPVWLVVDTARNDSLYAWLEKQKAFQIHSLYSGLDATLLAEVAPYLIKMDKSPLLQRLIVEAWGDRCAIFIESNAPPEALRIQLKKNLIAMLDENKTGYFRFYDPSVLGSFMQVASFEQLDHLFGSTIIRIHAEFSHGRSIMTVKRREDGLSTLVLGKLYETVFTKLE